MPDQTSYFKPHLELADDPQYGNNRRGRRPVIFDILAPDRETSLLPDNLRLVLHVNPRTMSLSYAKQTQRVQTRGGFVEFHWGDAAEEITFDAATGGFMRMKSGLSNITGGRGTQGRRETIAYDKYLDLLALFHNNGAIYDRSGNVVTQGYIKITFDGGVHIGWFDGQFTVTEAAEKPYMFEMSARFIIDEEILNWRSSPLGEVPAFTTQTGAVTQSQNRENEATPSTTVLDPEAASVRDAEVDPYLAAEEEYYRGSPIGNGARLPPGFTTFFPTEGG